jgi:long-chain acyl-CoA synthetase
MQGKATGATGISESDLPLQRFYRWERERANQLFLSQPFGGGNVREWTWSQAAIEIRGIAGYLKAQNWEPGSHVAILSKNCAWWIMADLAIWMAGHVTVPVYPSLRAQTVRQIIEHSESKACFVGATDEKDAATLGIPPGVIPIRFPTALGGYGEAWDAVLAASEPVADHPTRPADDLATIFYTSGTTGAPKGVMQTFTSFSFLTKALSGRVDLSGEQHRVLSYLPLAHILERGGQELPAILLGWHVFFTEGPETFLIDLRRARPTSIFLSVPRLLLKFQQGVFEKVPRRKLDRLLRIPIVRRIAGKRVLSQLGLDNVRCAACGAAPLPPDLLLWYRRLGLNLMEGYGLTEAMITHLTRPGNVRPGYVGSALDGVEAKRAENGELLLKSPMNMLGYYKDPQGTRDAFTQDGFIRTGDLVEIDAEGQTKIVGRLKEQFKTSKGKYVAPAPIEMKLLSHPDVESCCLMGTGLSSPFAVVVLSAEAQQRCAADEMKRRALEESLSTCLDQVNAELEPHERVMFLAIVEGPWTIASGVMTPTLKLRRTPLEERYLAYVDEWKNQNRRIVWEAVEEKVRRAGGAEGG